MVKSIRKNEHKKKNKTLKDKSKTLKDKSSIEEHYNYPLRSRKGPIDTNILIEANKKFNEIKKSTNRPLLLSLFRKENIDKFFNFPKDIRHYEEYHNIFSKEIMLHSVCQKVSYLLTVKILILLLHLLQYHLSIHRMFLQR